MTNPAIQNDFSYYRRTISRNRINNLQVRGWCPPPAGSYLPQAGLGVAGLGAAGAAPSPPVPCSWMRRAR